MRRTLQSLLAILVLVGVFAAVFALLEANRPPPARRPPRELGPVPVEVRELLPHDVVVVGEGFGTLLPRREARLAPEVGGVVETVLDPWRAGHEVEAGTLLVALDPALLEREVAVAEAGLEVARGEVQAAAVEEEFAAAALVLARERHELALDEEERLRALAGSLDVSRSRLDAATAERSAAAQELSAAEGRVRQGTVRKEGAARGIAEAEARVALARERRARAEVRAPFDGVLSEVGPAVGSYLAPGVPLSRLLDVSKLRARIPVAAAELGDVEPGTPALLTAPASPGARYEALVVGVDAEADPKLRTVAVELELDARPPLRPGLLVRAVLPTREVAGALVLGRDELVWKDGHPVAFVCVSDDSGAGRIEARELELGARVEGGHLVLAGLDPGELLVTSPLGRLEGGEPCVRLERAPAGAEE